MLQQSLEAYAFGEVTFQAYTGGALAVDGVLSHALNTCCYIDVLQASERERERERERQRKREIDIERAEREI